MVNKISAMQFMQERAQKTYWVGQVGKVNFLGIKFMRSLAPYVNSLLSDGHLLFTKS